MNRRRTLWSALVLGLMAFAVAGVAIAQMAKIGSGERQTRLFADRTPKRQ